MDAGVCDKCHVAHMIVFIVSSDIPYFLLYKKSVETDCCPFPHLEAFALPETT